MNLNRHCSRGPREKNMKGAKMPYTAKQHRMFEAAAHNASFARKVDIPQVQAKKMANESVKKAPVRVEPRHVAALLMRRG